MSPPPRPRVTLHFAQSLDGRIATRTADSRWISGPRSTAFAHELRAESDAILIGSSTALSDDPLLTVREVPAPSPPPLRVVLDGRGRVPAGAKLAIDRSAPTIHATRATSPRTLPAHVERWELPARADGHGIDLHALCARLSNRGVRSVLVEGGRQVLTAFLSARLVDRLFVSIAPIVLGTGIDSVGDLGTQRLSDALRFELRRTWRLDDDVLVELAASW